MGVGLPVRAVLDGATEGQDQALGRRGDVVDRGEEGRLVSSRWLAISADLADVLARGRMDLAGGCRLG